MKVIMPDKFVGGLAEILYVQHIEQRLAYSKLAINCNNYNCCYVSKFF